MRSDQHSPLQVVITDCDHDDIEPELRIFDEAGLKVKLAECKTSADVVAQAREADAIINQHAPIDESTLDALQRCRAIVRYGVGIDTIDVEAASERGIWVINVPDYGVEEVSDHAGALLLNLLRGVSRLDKAVCSGDWDYSIARPLHRLRNLTVGVVGCGRIGAAFARKAKRFGMRVVCYDAAEVPEDLIQEEGICEVSFEELLSSSDAISLHLPLSKETWHLIGPEQFGLMKSGAYLINTSRGGLVDSAALLRALNEDEIAGAALDVLENEPPEEGDALISHKRTIITPHVAWYSEESYETLKSEVAQEVVRVLSGTRPRSPVN